ncbi:MAG: D-aminoacylase [Pirellulaceae bacterium]|nr:D-aminoacylase [Pirellulaceae bacterium]
MYFAKLRFVSILFVACAMHHSRTILAETYDVLLRNGTVHVGDGNPPVVEDVGIRDGRIVAIGVNLAVSAKQVYDCKDQVVCPGFIDLHTHSDDPILERETRANRNYLMQGCTTVVTGNCGGGHVDVAAYFKKIDKDGAGTHVAHLLPHGSLRSKVMGKDDRAPTAEELAEMQVLAEKAMMDGAFGMSTGLIYIPGTFAKTDELIAIAKSVAKHHGIYVSHIRGEGSGLLDSVQEAIKIGIEGGLPTHISHFKASGTDSWGSLHLAAAIIEKARSEGKIVTADQYPYIASSTSLEATLLPDWARAGGRTSLKKRLDDPELTARIRKDVLKSLNVIHRIQLATYKPRKDWIGKNLEEIAKAESIEVVDLVLLIERNGGAQIVNFGMSEEDVRMAMKLPWVATASDGSSKVPSESMPHPRSFGTFPRKIGRYAIEQNVTTLEAAIRSATSLPAGIIGMSDRGLLQLNKVADIVVFDPKAFRDQATYDEPYREPTGTKIVLVGGEVAVLDGKPTGVLAGKAIRKNSRAVPLP